MAKRSKRKQRSMPQEKNASPYPEWDAALERFAHRNASPDYDGYQEWLESQVQLQRQRKTAMIVPLYHSELQHNDSILKIIAELIIGTNEQLKSFPPDVNDNKRDRAFARLDLLLTSLTWLDPRAQEFIIGLVKEASNSDDNLDEGLDECTQSELRIRLFKLIRRNKEHAAFKVLGKLREASHDAGELAYLEAVCYFKTNQLPETIRYASRLAADHIDYPAAQALILESYALQGNAAGFIRTMNEASNRGMSPSFCVYLLQVLLSNSQEPESDVQRLVDLQPPFVTNDGETTKKRDPAERILNRHSSRLAIELCESLQEDDLAEEAIRQNEQNAGGPTGSHPAADYTLRRRQLLTALAADRQFAEQLQSSDEPYVPIVKTLLNVPYPVEFEDYYHAMMAQYKLNGREHFISNIKGSLTNLMSDPDERKWELISLGYEEALGRNDPDIHIFEEALREWPSYNERIIEIQKRGESLKWMNRLSPMGRIAYGSSSFFLEQAKRQGYRWRDGSMISLGFFRIIECELNVSLISTLRLSLASDQLQAAYDADLVELQGNGAATKKYQKFWDSMLRKLSDILQTPGSALELGTMHMLLGKVREAAGPGSRISLLIGQQLRRRMTEEGSEAFTSGELASLINGEMRKRYRNPPAHARFLPLTIAEECKQYVEDAIQKLHRWIIPDERDSQS